MGVQRLLQISGCVLVTGKESRREVEEATRWDLPSKLKSGRGATSALLTFKLFKIGLCSVSMLPPVIGHGACWEPESTLISLNTIHLGNFSMQTPERADGLTAGHRKRSQEVASEKTIVESAG